MSLYSNENDEGSQNPSQDPRRRSFPPPQAARGIAAHQDRRPRNHHEGHSSCRAPGLVLLLHDGELAAAVRDVRTVFPVVRPVLRAALRPRAGLHRQPQSARIRRRVLLQRRDARDRGLRGHAPDQLLRAHGGDARDLRRTDVTRADHRNHVRALLAAQGAIPVRTQCGRAADRRQADPDVPGGERASKRGARSHGTAASVARRSHGGGLPAAARNRPSYWAGTSCT